MKQHTPIHWSAHVTCAIAGTATVALLIISDLTHAATPGRWGVLSALVAVVIAAAIISDRCFTRIMAASDERAAELLTEVETAMERHAQEMARTYEGQTEVIAHAVCDAVVDVFDSRRAGDSATPIKPRR